jgi:hypothetical protein
MTRRRPDPAAGGLSGALVSDLCLFGGGVLSNILSPSQIPLFELKAKAPLFEIDSPGVFLVLRKT